MKTKNTLKKIKLKRIEKDLSQIRISELLGINKSYYSQIETGSYKNPSEELLLKLASILDFHNDEILWMFGKVPSDILSKLKDFPALYAMVRQQHEALVGGDKDET